jgi:hypothetical protein
MSNNERVVIQSGKAEAYEIIPAKKIIGADKYFFNPGLLAALKEAEEDIAAGRVREVKDSSQLWEGIQ